MKSSDFARIPVLWLFWLLLRLIGILLLQPAGALPEPAREPLPAPYPLTAAERDLVERVVMAEAGGEDSDGQRLVAQCIRNTAEARGMSPADAVRERGQYARPARYASASVKRAVAAVFDRGEFVTAEPIRFFYAPRCSAGRWHERRLTFVLQHGGHRFFKEMGA